MLATEYTLDPEALFTISAGGFSATADAFARDEEAETLWFLSMVGSQTALKAIWACLLKQPPDTAHLIRGVEGMALSDGYQRCVVPYQTIGTWTTKLSRLPTSGGWHALVYTRLAEHAFERDEFLLLSQAEDEAPRLHHRFLDRRSAPAPLLGHVAVGAGPRNGRDSPATVLRDPRLPLLPGRAGAESRPLRGRRIGDAYGARRGDRPGRGGGRERWIRP